MSALVFQNADLDYLCWLNEHVNGYVLNANTQPRDDYLILHTSKCRSIRNPKKDAESDCFTGNNYLKVCSLEVSELSEWIRKQGFIDFSKRCTICNPGGGKAYRRFNWSRDELILALDVYHNSPTARSNVTHPDIIALSRTLQELPIHPVEYRPPNFRNPNGVSMKLGNFLVYDPEYTGTGLPQGAKLEKEVWSEFSHDIVKLNQAAALIRRNYTFLKSSGINISMDQDEAEEGGVIFAMHKHYERDKSIIKKKKNGVFAKHMALECEVCNFDFAKIYGELGSEFAECHHTKPVASMKPGERTKLDDLSIVCANCHRMLHREKNLLSITSLKALITKEKEIDAIRNSFK